MRLVSLGAYSSCSPAHLRLQASIRPCVCIRHHLDFKPAHDCHGRRSSGIRASRGNSPLQIDNPELLVGDGVALTCFALYKQIAAIVTSPNFPGRYKLGLLAEMLFS